MLRVIALMTLGLAVVAVGCTSETTIVDSGGQPEGITVTGEGSAFGEPDVAILTLGVEGNAATVAEARAQADASMEALRQALTDGGVADEDVQTSSFSIQPRYSTGADPEIVGFTVSNLVTVKIRDVDATGELIDSAATAGDDNTRVESLAFTIDDPSTLEDQAREEAMAEARGKAETLAGAGDVALGAPRSISEGGGAIPLAFEEAALYQTADAATSIDAGQLEVRVTVTVVYGLD